MAKIELSAKVPDVVRAGEPFDVQLELELPSFGEVTIDSLDVSLRGEISYQGTYGSNRVDTESFVDLHVQSLGPTTLYARKDLVASFTIPEGSPATYDESFPAGVRYVVRVHVDIPWAFDVHEEHAVRVLPKSRARPTAEPLVAVFPSSTAPFLELALDDRRYAPGDVIEGELAIGNVGDRAILGVELSLVSREHMPGGALEAARHLIYRDGSSIREGVPSSFSIPVPLTAMPSFEVGPLRLRWSIEARLDVAGSESMQQVPIEIAPFDAPRERRSGETPRVGRPRWRALLRDVAAEHGLTVDDDDDDDDDDARSMTGVIAGCSVSVRAARSMISEVRWSSLGLGLEVRELAALGRKPGRDRRQTGAFLPLIVDSLRSFDEVALDDEHAEVHDRRSPYDDVALRSFVERVAAVATAISAARPQIPPPTALAHALPSWASFARDVTGNLQVGPLSITDIAVGASTCAIETLFDGEAPRGTRLRCTPASRLMERFPSENPEVIAMAASIEPHGALTVGEQSLVVIAKTATPDPARFRPVLEAMAALAARLGGDGRQGPYR